MVIIANVDFGRIQHKILGNSEQPGCSHAFSMHFICLILSPFLQFFTKLCMLLSSHIAVIVCSVYTMLVSRASRVDVKADGKPETERGENSHLHSHRQAGRHTNKAGGEITSVFIIFKKTDANI